MEIQIVHSMLARSWSGALFRYARTNEHRLPSQLRDAATLLDDDGQAVRSEAAGLGIDDEHFEIVYRGPLDGDPEKGKTIIIVREKQAFLDQIGRLARMYIFGDGHTETHYADNGSFEDFEREHGLTQ